MAARQSIASRWVSREMALLLVILVTLPLWIAPIGLYQYLGVEIAIWMIYGLGFNLLLGYSGLPSFGHGAFFGIGAYAFGLFQLQVFESLLLGIVFAFAAAFAAGAIVAWLPVSSARHLLRADDHRLRPGVLVHRHQVAHRHRRRRRAAEHSGSRAGARAWCPRI